MRGRKFVALLALSLAVVAAGSAGATGDPGFMTSQASMLTQGDRTDVEFKPIITVGERSVATASSRSRTGSRSSAAPSRRSTCT